MPEQSCEYCGDPIIGQCKTKHAEWIIVLPAEIRKSDTILRPLDGRMYQVLSVLPSPDPSAWDDQEFKFTIRTGQKVTFTIHCPELPVLVKRDIPCGWPRCDLHCVRCMRIAEESFIEREKMKDAGTLPEKKRRRKAKDDPYTAERIYVRSSARARKQAASRYL